MSDNGTRSRDTTDRGSTELTVSVAGHIYPVEKLILILGALFLLTVPFTLGRYYMNVLSRALIFCIFALSLDLLWGYGGILSFGHAAFFGFGAYLMGKILMTGSTVAGYGGIMLGAILPGLLGLTIAGVLFYRNLDENTFVIITLAIAVIAQQIAISGGELTGGYNGLTGIPPLQVGIPFIAMVPVDDLAFYYLSVVVLYIAYQFSKRVINSSFGTTLVAIRENEKKARALGYNLTKYKTIAFGIASAMAGFAGALQVAQSNTVGPSFIGFVLSTQVIIWVIVGGRGTLTGAMVGTIFLVLFESIASGIFQFGWTVFLGILLVVIVVTFPGGMMEFISIINKKIIRQKSES